MAILSRKVDYALLILSFLHHRPEGGCMRVIADRFGLKKPFTANVLKLLCQRGLVRSERGIHGGYVLARPAAEIHLDELLDLMGEPFSLADCNRPPCGEPQRREEPRRRGATKGSDETLRATNAANETRREEPRRRGATKGSDETLRATNGADTPCGFESVCPVRGAIAEVDRRIREVLRKVTLADLFQHKQSEGVCVQLGLEMLAK